jgi:hypothetical protein
MVTMRCSRAATDPSSGRPGQSRTTFTKNATEPELYVLERFANRVASCEDSAHGHLLERSQDEGSRSGRAGHPQKRRGRDLLRLAEDAQTLA